MLSCGLLCMRLGINGWRLCGPRTGVRRYLLNLLLHWTAPASAGFTHATLYTPSPIDRRSLGLPPAIRDVTLAPAMRMLPWENLRLGPWTSDDVLFCPSFSRPLVTRGRTVVATHDMVYRVRPELFPRSNAFYSRLYEWSDRHATLVITDAEAVKEEIVHYCRVPAEKVRVTYLAPAELFTPVEQTAATLSALRQRWVGADVPYLLFVGKITGRRSLPMLLDGFAEFRRRVRSEHRLLLIGPGTESAMLKMQARQLGLETCVRHAGFVPDDQLNAVYNAATALVSAGVYETSSLPVMEAQAAGLPVICFRNPGMVEITDGAASMYDRPEAAPLADAMLAVAEDDGYRTELSRRGLVSARRFSWARCARETLDILREAATR